jgi:hypothetical protein
MDVSISSIQWICLSRASIPQNIDVSDAFANVRGRTCSLTFDQDFACAEEFFVGCASDIL